MPDCVSEEGILELKKEEENDGWVGKFQSQGGEDADGEWVDMYHCSL